VTPLFRLEQYTLKRPQEVLLVVAEFLGEQDQVMVFKGFSSSLTRPTAFDPDIAVLPEDAQILAIDRLQAPYSSTHPTYLQQGITWDEMQAILEEIGL
jgi:hypothetical protein